MGGVDFTTTAWGKTPREAFVDVRDSAQHDKGHGGYTGSIAEKHDFVVFTLPPRLTASKLIGWVMDTEDHLDVDYLAREVREQQARVTNAPKGTKRAAQARLSQVKKQLAEAERQRAKFVRQLGPHLDLVERIYRVWTDKWGPACCVEITSPAERKLRSKYLPQPKRGMKMYVFFGMASS